MRDTYGNRMLADFTSQLRYHTASVLCNPRDMEDVRCTPVDEAPVEGPWAHRTGDVYHRIKLKETGESGGLTVTDADEAMRCYSEDISGDCRDLYNAVEVSVCYEVQNPKMCIDPKQVSGTLNIYAKFHLKAEGTSVQSSPTVAVDMSQYYDCSGGDEVSILSSMAAGAARGECRHLFGEMHTCDLVPTIGGNFLLRLLVNEQDASFGLWAVRSCGGFFHTESGSSCASHFWVVTFTRFHAETGNVYTLEAGLSYTQGPTEILMNIGDINTSTSTVEGPGLDLAGNVVGVPVMVLVQLKDQYGNNRIVTGSDFQQRLNGILASLGDTALDTVVNDNGTISVTARCDVRGSAVQTIIAGYHRLRIRMGIGCLQANPVELCDDISGSPSELLWWKAAEVSENGMTCDTPYIFQASPVASPVVLLAGTKYHFTCTGRDLFSNLNPDHELQLVAYFDFQADRGNLTGYNLNQSFRGSYSPVDSLPLDRTQRYHFEPTVYRAGYYSIEIYLSRGRPRGEQTIILCTPAQPSNMSSVVVPFVTASATVANEVNIQTRDRFGNAIEVNGGDIVTGLLYGEQQVSISFIHLVQGRYRGVLVPQDAGATVVDFKVAGESILGSPFDFLVTPGPMVITRSLVEGFPSELTAGKLSCWNITLRDVAWMQEVTQKRPWRVCLERVR
ncbi:Alpha-amylase [Durusdinium trenchii]|uniref:Alpha-amylase n=1 Tax=Durusdinium trenchii TaxID=1381693 RepID=A0ABP0K716_9DINO